MQKEFRHIAPLKSVLVGYPSGQRGQTVNLLAYAFLSSNLRPTTISYGRGTSHIRCLSARTWVGKGRTRQQRKCNLASR